MSRAELGLFEDDPRSQQGADALAILDSQIKTPAQREFTWAAKDLFVPKEPWNNEPMQVATRAAVREERTFSAYRQREAWVMKSDVKGISQQEVSEGEVFMLNDSDYSLIELQRILEAQGEY